MTQLVGTVVKVYTHVACDVTYSLNKACKMAGLLSSNNTNKDEEITYEFKWSSAAFASTVFVASFNGFILLVWILNGFLDISYPVRLVVENSNNWIGENLIKGSELIGIINSVIKVSMPVGSWILTSAHLVGVHYLCDFLNDWPNFFQQFEAVFIPNYRIKFNLTRKRNVLCIIWLTPVVILCFSMKAVNTMADHIPSIVLNGMTVQYQAFQTNISTEQVHGWMKLISLLRLQSSRVENYIGLQNLWSIFEVFLSVLMNLSMMVFLFMNNALTSDSNFLPYVFIFTSFFLLSLYWKIHFSESITATEQTIVGKIVEMDTPDDDSDTRLEMKLICDMICNDPTEIRIGNILTLNKSLLLAPACIISGSDSSVHKIFLKMKRHKEIA
ncbi:hypothetical protein Ocin01_05603 [Orchesella cincta]|uniref:Uncharacterized protein n=1 Tax=Orchesella cincta TaxID=48709 RepID=A0A1D2N734_ORCCI|nr:hypothetical protein Ocin01_05603 [Orchesella cincta]